MNRSISRPPIIRSGFPRAGSLSGNAARDRFEAGVLDICGDVRLFWLPRPTETTTSTDRSRNARVFTENATMAGRFVTQGSGVGVTYNGTSDYASFPDADDISFGDGVVDQPLSIVSWQNVTNTEAARWIVSHYDGAAGNREWELYVDASDQLNGELVDNSSTGSISYRSTAAITQGSISLFGMTYDGTAELTGINLYSAGARIARTSTAGGTYVALENKSALGLIWADQTNTAIQKWFSGTGYCIVLTAKHLSDDEMWHLKTLGNA